jgi:hypothetical protein
MDSHFVIFTATDYCACYDQTKTREAVSKKLIKKQVAITPILERRSLNELKEGQLNQPQRMSRSFVFWGQHSNRVLCLLENHSYQEMSVLYQLSIQKVFGEPFNDPISFLKY